MMRSWPLKDTSWRRLVLVRVQYRQSTVTNLTKIGPHFAAGEQEDAHEFLRSLTANMHLADLRVGGSPHPHTQQHTNMLDGIFGGLLRSRVRCRLCLTDSVRYNTFLDLSLDENPRQKGRKMTSFRGATAKLGACVDNELGGSAPHQCR